MASAPSPLERLMALREADADEQSVDLLKIALRLSTHESELDLHREVARREHVFPPEQIAELAERSDEMGDVSPSEQYFVMEVLQAAAVAGAGLQLRNLCSIRLAVAARSTGRIERARRAYADVFEGLHILRRFFRLPEHAVAQAEQGARQGWLSVKDRAAKPLDPLDPASDQPAAEWLDLILWNSDRDSGQALLAQADATPRLALHFDHWTRDGHDLEPHVDEMCSRCDDLAREEEPMLAARCLVTVGDALIEIGRWDLAAATHRRAPRHISGGASHPLAIHATVQEAYCRLMSEDSDGCRRLLDAADRTQMESLSELVLTVAAELSRYHAVDDLCRRRRGAGDGTGARDRIRPLMERLRLLLSEGEDRQGYLRSLFYSMVSRDVELIHATTASA